MHGTPHPQSTNGGSSFQDIRRSTFLKRDVRTTQHHRTGEETEMETKKNEHEQNTIYRLDENLI